MITYRNNGENWYRDSRSIWKRVRQWFIWVGGWELANGSGWKLKHDWGWASPTPISIFGHWATFYSWGTQFRWGRSWLVYSKHSGTYVSKDGTPSGAHIWITGTPWAIEKQAELNKPSAEEGVPK